MKLRLITYALKKLGEAVLTLLMLSILLFYTTTLFSPQYRASMLMSQYSYQFPSGVDPIAKLIEKYGLNDPFPVQYWRWIREIIFNHNLGWSQSFNAPVTDVILSSFPATIELVMYSAPIAVIGGYKFGSFLGKRASLRAPREDPVDFVARSGTVIAYSIPSFVLGLLLLIFWARFSQLPIGRLSIDVEHYVYSTKYVNYTGLYSIDGLLNGQPWISLDALKHLLLPVITLTAAKFAVVVRITRSNIIRESFKNYIIGAKAKGLDRNEITKHAKKNSLISVFTVSGTLLAGMLTGVIVTEYLFRLAGIGTVVLEAAQRLDYPLLIALSMLFCTIFMVINLIVDFAYAFVDPRVRT